MTGLVWWGRSPVRHAAGVLQGVVDDDVIVYLPPTHDSMGLSGTAAWIWEMAAQQTTLEDLVRSAVAEFGVPAEVCRPDILSALDLLRSRGFLAG